jgi:beta-phosphoglucomutase-like phosphatase (HAD superfamily)
VDVGQLPGSGLQDEEQGPERDRPGRSLQREGDEPGVAVPIDAEAARLEAAGLPTPKVLITSDRTVRGKPHPDPYLAGAAALGADPADCLVIEDAPAGIAAARAAGMTVWAVTTTHSPDELAGADRVLQSLDEVRTLL